VFEKNEYLVVAISVFCTGEREKVVCLCRNRIFTYFNKKQFGAFWSKNREGVLNFVKNGAPRVTILALSAVYSVNDKPNADELVRMPRWRKRLMKIEQKTQKTYRQTKNLKQ
jgi:hypothetical protein